MGSVIFNLHLYEFWIDCDDDAKRAIYDSSSERFKSILVKDVSTVSKESVSGRRVRPMNN